MRRALLALLLCAVAAPAADREFESLIRGLEQHYGKKKIRIPLFGAVRFFMNTARPKGVSGFNLAVFEDVDNSMQPGEEQVASLLGGSKTWRLWVSAKEQRETSLIYVDPTPKRWKLMVVSFEPNETAVVKMSLSERSLRRWLSKPQHRGRDRDED